MQKAQEIQLKQGNTVLLADTHLNLCAMLSSQERHQEALEHILIAVVLLQDEYAGLLSRKLQGNSKEAHDKTGNNLNSDHSENA